MHCQPCPSPITTSSTIRNTGPLSHVALGVRTLLPARLLDLGGLSVSYEPVVRLELLHCLGRIVNERETGALAATVLSPEAEAGDLVLVRLVEFAELGAELILGDVRAVWVEDVTV